MRLLNTNQSVVEDTYNNAIKALNASIHVEKIIESDNPDAFRITRIKRIREGLKILGISDEKVDQLRIIHVTGSKGKGSTCAMIESLLRHSGYKTGFLSSPHLVNVEERIRINGRPIEKGHFAQLFWNVYDSIHKSSTGTPICTYLQYITLMACCAFCEENVDAVIMEVGIGGRFDHTNFFHKPAVSVVTGISLEHTDILGHTVEEIARKKAGVFKPGCPAVVPADLDKNVLEVFIEEASAVGCPLYPAPRAEDVPLDDLGSYNSPPFSSSSSSGPWDLRSRNVGLSLTVTHLWLLQLGGYQFSRVGLQPPLEFVTKRENLETALAVKWPGRWHQVRRNNVVYFIDGAHTVDSLEHTARWFQSESSRDSSASPTRVLLFTVVGNRDPQPMLQCLRRTIRPQFDLVVFANPHLNESDVPQSKLSLDAECLDIWTKLQMESSDGQHPIPSCRIRTVDKFVDWIGSNPINCSAQSLAAFPSAHHSMFQNSSSLSANCCCHVLVTGSLYLVGAVLGALREVI